MIKQTLPRPWCDVMPPAVGRGGRVGSGCNTNKSLHLAHKTALVCTGGRLQGGEFATGTAASPGPVKVELLPQHQMVIPSVKVVLSK